MKKEDQLEILDDEKGIRILPSTENNGARREERLCTVKEFAQELIRIFEAPKLASFSQKNSKRLEGV